jgi:DNA-binding NtrC family response regulator
MTTVHGNLLVVDDDETNREVLATRLGSNGYAITQAEDGQQALGLIEQQRFDLVLLDVMMPGLNGLEVLQTVRRSHPLTELPVIMATARDSSADVVQALQLGANDYVTKPFDLPVVLARVQTQLALKRAVAQVGYLREEIQSEYNFAEIVGASPALRELLDKLQRVAPTDTTVLLLGETGTGKELLARAIHDLSPRRGQPLVKVNCGAISAGLVESELFGHEKGAFTGAHERRTGRFELADQGTIFLDEVGDLPADTQVKLLRVLQEKEFERVGSSRPLRVDVRVIAATNRDLSIEVKEKRFRQDLYYRLSVFPLQVPSLRERADDIPLLAEHFLNKFGKMLGKQFSGVDPEALRRLRAYSWPGNIRELQNVLERAAILSAGPVVHIDDPLGPVDAATQPVTSPGTLGTLEETERNHILRVLNSRRWAIEGKDGAAAVLGLNPSTLRSRMQKLGIRRPANP